MNFIHLENKSKMKMNESKTMGIKRIRNKSKRKPTAYARESQNEIEVFVSDPNENPFHFVFLSFLGRSFAFSFISIQFVG